MTAAPQQFDHEVTDSVTTTPATKVLAALKSTAWDEERETQRPTSWTIPALAAKTGLSFTRVSNEIERLARQGKVSSRTHRSGAVLWKLFDPMESHGGFSIYPGGSR